MKGEFDMIRSLCAAALAIAAVFITLAPEAGARPHNRNWELLGRQSVGFLKDRDVVQVGRSDGDFSKIQLRVRNNEVEFTDLKVVYGNGQSDDIQVRNKIPAGGQTRVIDLKGGDRFIKRIELAYRSKPSFRGQAVVEVWGRD
jgi:hypothetical protein